MDRILGEILSDKNKESVLGHLDENKEKSVRDSTKKSKKQKAKSEELTA